MRAGIADDFRLRFPEMYQEYRRLCHHELLALGGAFLWKLSEPWVLNLVTQDSLRGATSEYVAEAFRWLATSWREEGIQSVAMPRVGAGPGGLEWDEVRSLLEGILGPCSLPVTVYELGAPTEGESEEPDADEPETGDVFLGPSRGPRWRPLSNFHRAPMIVRGKEYATLEHFYQATKATGEEEHEHVRSTPSPGKAKRRGRAVTLRDDWEDVKVAVMREGLLAKFGQHAELRDLLLSTGDRGIHEDARYDAVWGWRGGEGQDLLGKLLVEVRGILRREGGDRDGLRLGDGA